jgi:hypothetical protein
VKRYFLTKSHSLNKLTAPNSESAPRVGQQLSYRQVQQMPTINFSSMDKKIESIKLKVKQSIG